MSTLSKVRLKRFEVEGLFGLFDHQVPLRLDHRITIIHAPNGFGKTIILKMISSFFGGSLDIFESVEFKTVRFIFDDGSVIRIDQGFAQESLFNDEPKKTIQAKQYSIFFDHGDDSKRFEPFKEQESRGHFFEDERTWRKSILSRKFPFLVPTDDGFFDRRQGDFITAQQARELYGARLPNRFNEPEWLERIRDSIHCSLIETQRLIVLDSSSSFRNSEAKLLPVVRNYAKLLAEQINLVLAKSATLAQSLDQTFPSRIVTKTAQRDIAEPSEESLRSRLDELEKKRIRLAKTDLLEQASGGLIATSHFTDATKRILDEYIQDTEKKLQVFDSILEKLELFSEILNSRLKFKQIKISKKDGFMFVDHNSKPLSSEKLSSGEQHELVILYQLLFQAKDSSLILIDEPEISLHIEWQRRFLSDLEKIIALTNIDVVVSTHSPQLIASQIDDAIILKAPVDVSQRN